MLNVLLVKDSMYVEQPNNLKPETFDRATHFLTHSDCLRIKNMHKELIIFKNIPLSNELLYNKEDKTNYSFLC